MSKLTNKLPEIFKRLEQNASLAVQKTARQIADDAAQNAPVRSGRLKRSYEKTEAVEMINDLTAHVGSDEPHSVPVEFGGANTAADPHLVPAFVSNKETFKNNLIDAAKDAAK